MAFSGTAFFTFAAGAFFGAAFFTFTAGGFLEAAFFVGAAFLAGGDLTVLSAALIAAHLFFWASAIRLRTATLIPRFLAGVPMC